jgi:Protein of unknown function (DUF2849)
MAKKLPLPAILVANDLLTGRIVIWGEKGFVDNPSLALVAQNDLEAQELEERGAQYLAKLRIVDPELISVKLNGEGLPIPTHFREKIRLFGPTINYINQNDYHLHLTSL